MAVSYTGLNNNGGKSMAKLGSKPQNSGENHGSMQFITEKGIN